MTDVFSPSHGASTGVTLTISATGTSSSTSIPAGAKSFRLYNKGPDLVYFRTGSSSQTATSADVPFPAGGIEVFGKGPADVSIGVICDTGCSATLYFTPGVGQ